MLNIALTGNVAAGKSTVAQLFRDWGATVIEADLLARQVQRPGGPVLAAISRRFGPGVLRPDGELDRPALRAIILRDPHARAALNAIVHPAIRNRRAALIAGARTRGDRIVVSDIPLLFEAADAGTLDLREFDAIVLVDAPAEVRRRRLITTRSLDPTEADRLIAAQLPAEPKRSRSTYVIENSGDLAALEQAARAVWDALEAQAAGRA